MLSVRATSSYIVTPLVMALAVGLLAVGSPAAADPYYNSSEPGCNGSDPNVLFCDDFEDGDWFYNTEQSGQLEARADGWGAPITSNPTGAARCGAGVTPFGNCAATGGTRSGVGGANMGLHFFKTSTCGTDGTQLCPVPEVYVRWYAKWDAGYQFGAEKHLNVTNDTGDIAFANVQLNCAASGSSPTATVKTQVIHGDPVVFANCGPLNVSDITIQSGRWYFFEYNVRASNSPAGIGRVRLWVNDCGVDGKSCGPAPILRTDRTGSLPGNSNGSQITTIWLENWANPPSSGTGPLWDQIKVSRVGPIGFAGSGGSIADTTPPGVPGAISIR